MDLPVYHYATDTETTGLSPADGDRIIEIAAVEIHNLEITGRIFHSMVNPGDREITYSSYNVHKISAEMVSAAPKFSDIYENFINFTSKGSFVIHNKQFDLGFLTAESERLGVSFPFGAIDTIDLARQKWPGTRVGLDALCRNLNIPRDEAGLRDVCARYGIDHPAAHVSRSERHSALVDAILLAQVFIAIKQTNELDLTHAGLRSQKPWPFADQKISIKPLCVD